MIYPLQILTQNRSQTWVKHKTIELVEENIGEYPNDLGFGNDFLDAILKAQAMKKIIDNLDLIKIKNSCSEKDCINRMRKAVTD